MAITTTVVAGCGSTGGKSAALLRPPSPVDLSVYISDSRVSVSPTAVGAGPIVFVVTNQSGQSQSLAIAGGSRTLASTAPINPQGTTQVTVDVKPGTYTIATASHGSDAQQSQPSPVAGATIHVGRRRPSSSDQLLQP
ncbi:MAG TPA: hypothetical protein VG325_12155 [Solirubrobacteraceae bacterium]|nr:hypothetical protein [Solirubrobacteraceae bacterium]